MNLQFFLLFGTLSHVSLSPIKNRNTIKTLKVTVWLQTRINYLVFIFPWLQGKVQQGNNNMCWICRYFGFFSLGCCKNFLSDSRIRFAYLIKHPFWCLSKFISTFLISCSILSSNISCYSIHNQIHLLCVSYRLTILATYKRT